MLLFYKVLFFFALFLFRETLTDVKIETEKLTKNIYPFFFFACKLTNESYVTRRTVARPNLTLLANTSYLPPHPLYTRYILVVRVLNLYRSIEPLFYRRKPYDEWTQHDTSSIHRFIDVACIIILTISSCLAWPSIRVLFNYRIRGWKRMNFPFHVFEINIICTIKSIPLQLYNFINNFTLSVTQKKENPSKRKHPWSFPPLFRRSERASYWTPITICPRYIAIMGKVRIKGGVGVRDGWESEARRGAKTAFNFRG